MKTNTTLLCTSTLSFLLGLSNSGCVDELDVELDEGALLDDDSVEHEQPATSEDLSAPAPASVPATLSTPTLVGRWALDGDVDDSVGFNHGAAFGATSYVAGVDGQGQALRIDAQGGGASMDSIVDAFGTDDFAVSVWVNYHGDFAGHVRHEHVFTDGWGGGSNRKFDLFAERGGGATYWVLGSGLGEPATAPWISQQDQWHHVVMGRTGPDKYLCIDGQLFSQDTNGPTDMSNDDGFYLGRNPHENGGRSFPGALDELRVYDAWVGEDGCACLYADPQTNCFDEPEPAPGWCTHGTAQLELGDLDADGTPDFVCHDTATGYKWIDWGHNGWNGTDDEWNPSWCHHAGSEFTLEDIDLDGRDDFVCRNESDTYTWYDYANNGFNGTDWAGLVG